MWSFWTTFLLIGTALFLVNSDDGKTSVTESTQGNFPDSTTKLSYKDYSGAKVKEISHENCSDPNAELRYDNSSCILTCTTKGLDELPDFCFGKAILTEDCYCKQRFYLDESSGKCLQQQDCPCNAAANETSKFSNECANGCATFHTMIPCPGPLFSGCWCVDTYCTNENGTCVPKER